MKIMLIFMIFLCKQYSQVGTWVKYIGTEFIEIFVLLILAGGGGV